MSTKDTVSVNKPHLPQNIDVLIDGYFRESETTILQHEIPDVVKNLVKEFYPYLLPYKGYFQPENVGISMKSVKATKLICKWSCSALLNKALPCYDPSSTLIYFWKFQAQDGSGNAQLMVF